MGILSNAKRRLGYFILDHIVTQEVIQQWKSGYIKDPLPDIVPTQVVPAVLPDPKERNTDRIDAKAVEAAIKAQNAKAVRGRALDVPQEHLAPGKLIRWYRDQENHVNRVTNEDTVSLNAIKLQEELRRRLDGEGQGWH